MKQADQVYRRLNGSKVLEVVLSLCLSGTEICRDVLVPGLTAATPEECVLLLDQAPQGARCVPQGPVLTVQEIAPGIFAHLGAIAEPDAGNGGDIANLGFVIGARSVAVIDTGGAAWVGEALWRAIRAQTDLPVSHVIFTHVHPDHVLGAQIFQASGATMVGHAALPRALADRRGNYLESMARLLGDVAFLGSDVPQVTQLVEDNAQIDLGARVLQLQAWPLAHSGTDLTVLDSQTKTLFTGDLVFHQHTPALDGSLRGWQATLESLRAIDAVRAVPGHGGPVLDWPGGEAGLVRYLDLLAKDTSQAIARGERLGEAVTHIAEDEAGSWFLFDAFNPRNATVAFTELEWE